MTARLCLLSLLPMLLAADKPDPKAKPNRLAKEASPYLRQHGHNPVDWYPWGEEAFAKAKKENKLVFISIGYSACHWCHVMERESFSNADVAKVLNDNFVCIKVDREERPDIDEIYITALYVLGERGGWPLSMFATPEGKPLFGGTYWPPDDRKVGDDTLMGFKSVLKKVLEIDKDKRKELLEQGDEVAKRTAQALNRAGSKLLVELDRDLVKNAAAEFTFDTEHGGFGSKANQFRGTKFPRASAMMFLIKQSRLKDSPDLAKPVALTLDKMAAGGIYDHLGGGFHRYSTERTWTVPHFEKMLYDNAQLAELYSEACRQNANPAYRRVVDETLAFVAREMTAPDGGFYSALDADTDGKEGEFYIWSPKELDTILGDSPEAKLFRSVYGLEAPNFEGKSHILRLPRPLADVAKDRKLTEAELIAKLAPWKAKLLAARDKRERPFLDTKILTGWNGQMIAGYARAGEVFQEPKYVAAAEKAADFVLAKLRTKDGRLMRVYAARPGEPPEARIPAFLEDYSFLLHGLLTLHDATGKAKWLDAAKSIADAMTKHHADERGGFFTTAHDHEKLFARSKDVSEGAQPSGNGTAAQVLARLWLKTKDDKYRAAAEGTVKAFIVLVKASPASAPTIADTLDRLLAEPGGLTASGLAEPVAPANPKDSSEVVNVTVKAAKPVDGKQSLMITLSVAKPWHVYANPPGGKGLEQSATEIEVFVDGKKVDAALLFPEGKATTDPTAGDYRIYEGTVRITGTIPRGPDDGPVLVRVKLIACRDGKCLLPATIKAEPR